MKRKKSSSSDQKHFYQRPEKIHRFWNEPRNEFVYSEESREYFEKRAQVFTEYEQNSKKWEWIKRATA